MNYIYDLDDTLIQNSDLPLQAVHRMFSDIISSKKKISLKTSGNKINKLKQLYAHYHYLETRRYMEKDIIEPATGVKKFLEETDGFQAGLTNAPYRSTKYKLKELGLEEFFDDLVTARDGVRKPSPEGLEKIIQNSGLERDSFVFVGDSIKDLVAGKRAGLRTVLITADLKKKFLADETYSSFREFMDKH
jgi:HAD superfamily hydrolase (TIGR01509 family)